MRVLVVDTYYPRFLDEHYEKSTLEDASYDEQLAALMARAFGTSDAYSTELRRLGHEAWEIVVNAMPLQAAWAREHGMRTSLVLGTASRLPTRAGLAARQAFQNRIAMAQIEHFSPDVLYCQDLGVFTSRELSAIHARGIFVAGQIASPAPETETLRCFDLICTSFPHFVDRFRAIGVASEYLPIGFDTRLSGRAAARGFDPATQAARDIDVSFVGSVDPRVHPSRVALLEQVCRKRPIAVYGNGIDALPAGSSIRGCFLGEAWGLSMYELLARSRITLNRHIDAAEGCANNMRLYEATGMGAMLLTDNGTNLSEIFQPDVEVESYAGAADLIKQLDLLLIDEERRSQIARAGRERTLADHSYSDVIARLSEILTDHC